MKKSDVNQKLIKAFFHSLENKHYSKISVTDLITQADCSRTTFYRYYTDVLDMYNKICEELIDIVLGELADSFSKENSSLSETLEMFCDKLESQKYYIRLLCGENGGRRFFEIALERAILCADSLSPFRDENERFLFKFVLCSGIGSYIKSMIDYEDFDIRNIEMYREILYNAKKGSLKLE